MQSVHLLCLWLTLREYRNLFWQQQVVPYHSIHGLASTPDFSFDSKVRVSAVHELLSSELPFLRRYARAMTGDQASGDACVEELLEDHLLPSSAAEAPLPETRIELFGLLDAIVCDRATRNSGAEDTVLASLSSLPRRALFLTAVEQFTPDEAAQILQVEPDEVDDALQLAQHQLANALATNVLIIEDEALIAFNLRRIVESLGHTMSANATTRSEAADMAQKVLPGLVLVDIQLADGSSGLDALDDILKVHPVPAVVITAFPERLLSGHPNEPAFLIPKPFNQDHVKAVISQALISSRAV